MDVNGILLYYIFGWGCWWCPASILLSFEKLFCLLLLYMNVYVLCTILLYVGWFHFSFFFFSLLFRFSCLPDYCLAFRNIGSVLKKLIPISTFFSIEEWCCEVEEEPCLCRVLEIENLILSTWINARLSICFCYHYYWFYISGLVENSTNVNRWSD